jgi:hypothetical protein
LMQAAFGRGGMSVGGATHENARGCDEGKKTEDLSSRLISHVAT